MGGAPAPPDRRPRRALLAAWYWLPLLAYAGLIFAVSSMPHPPVPAVDLPGLDKLLHLAEYLGFGLLLFRALAAGGQGLSPGAAIAAAVAMGALYGASDEVHQSFVPPRQADVADWAADVLGTGAGAVLYRVGAAWRARRRARH